MGRIKLVILSILFIAIYVFAFVNFNNIEWLNEFITLILFIILIFLIFIPWQGNIIKIYKNIKENNKMLSLQDEKNFMPDKNKKIAVMLSGGVDSAVVAKLLIDQGYEIECFFMRNWDSTTNLELNNILTEDEICQQEEDYLDAKKVSKFLGVKLHRVDFVKEYWDDVFSVFLKEIEQGLTPNPDILCNRHIKFDRFVSYVNEYFPEFSYVATGHYAKIVERQNKKLLAQAKDSFKDQTYFLAEINIDILDKVIFPLADLKKDEVREIAKELKIPVANKKDSTGICFIGKRNFPEFISNYLKENPGKIVDLETGQILGEHRGVLFYTIGQRKGLNLGGFDNPYFVSKKDIENNVIYVSKGKNNEALLTKEIFAKKFNFLVDENIINDGMKIKFKTRHSEIIYDGIINHIGENEIRIDSKEEIKAVTPGQELVVYFNGICIGGGQIK
ncbi:MAG: tRNA-specific 2-thiouridylase MnmA [Candidatus Tyloplasma litorale]|nr:MAG: tRNA-specific 2-thiouridylase MnmA [Mycoplasmatales bacterium]